MPATLLIVEDDESARLALSRLLEAAGYLVTQTGLGEQAVELLAAQTFDVVLSDLRLPGIGGVEVLQRAVQCTPPPSVVLLTGYGTLETAIAALRFGAVDYLLKPCPPHALLDVVAAAVERRRETLQRHEALHRLASGVEQLQRQLVAIGALQPTPAGADHVAQGDTIVWGELAIGRFPHEIRLGDQPLHLTPIEHALLRRLAEGQGEPVTYSEIVRRTHGYMASEAEAQLLLKSHLRNIRRKVGDDLIANVRNLGYRLAQADERVGRGAESDVRYD